MSNPYLVDVCILAILNKVAIRVEVATRTCGSNRHGSQARSAATSAESPGKAWTKATNASGTTSGTTCGANSSNSTSTSASRSHKCAVWNSIQIRYLMIFVWYCTAGIGWNNFPMLRYGWQSHRLVSSLLAPNWTFRPPVPPKAVTPVQQVRLRWTWKDHYDPSHWKTSGKSPACSFWSWCLCNVAMSRVKCANRSKQNPLVQAYQNALDEHIIFISDFWTPWTSLLYMSCQYMYVCFFFSAPQTLFTNMWDAVLHSDYDIHKILIARTACRVTSNRFMICYHMWYDMIWYDVTW